MYEITCTLSREMLLAPYLVKQTMPASRIKEMKAHRAQMARHSAGSGAALGALREAPLWIGWNQPSAAYVLSVCAITEMVRSDLTKIVLKWKQMHWAVRRRAMTRHRGARNTPSHLLYSSPWAPSLPSLGSTEAQGCFSRYGEVPSHGFRRTCKAGHSVKGSGGKRSCCCLSHTAYLGEAEVIGMPYPILLSEAKLCLDSKTFNPWWNPQHLWDQGWWQWKAASVKILTEFSQVLQYLIPCWASLQPFQLGPKSNRVHSHAALFYSLKAIPVQKVDSLIYIIHP